MRSESRDAEIKQVATQQSLFLPSPLSRLLPYNERSRQFSGRNREREFRTKLLALNLRERFCYEALIATGHASGSH